MTVTPAVSPTLPAPALSAEPTPAASPAPAPASSELPFWLWPVLGGVLLLGGGLVGWWMGRRRRRVDADEPVVVVAPPEPASPPTPGPPPLNRKPTATPNPASPQRSAPPAPLTPPPDGPLVAELRPLRAAIRDGMVTVDFELFVQNRGRESADNIRAVLALLGANAQQDEQVATFHAAARMAAGAEPFSLAPGGVYMLGGQVSLPGDRMPVVNVQGKPMFVPVIPVALKWYAGLTIRTLRDCFMVGTMPAQGGDRLGPLWVERAADGFGRLAAKRYAPRSTD